MLGGGTREGDSITVTSRLSQRLNSIPIPEGRWRYVRWPHGKAACSLLLDLWSQHSACPTPVIISRVTRSKLGPMAMVAEESSCYAKSWGRRGVQFWGGIGNPRGRDWSQIWGQNRVGKEKNDLCLCDQKGEFYIRCAVEI
jgi:hypothetical protein